MRNAHLVSMAALLASVEAFAASNDCSCRNGEFEISCDSDRCESSESFTPAGGGVNTSTKDMSVCAYSGCWEGKADSIITSQDHIIAYSDQLKGNNPGLQPTSAAIIIDRETLGATLNAFGFQSPMSCSLK
ncbi:hypothetical protein GOB15_07185 [Sinorhizobium meliloti]|nr:hypothetical protein [Sinorhizobium meliloti]MDW9509443.1 hypothetical protein [Sinorhizobium meliloti]MDX0772330.1 hypothetical protein [Sinorhizobium medicae]MDX0907186.1 hypothetical protein [Sinorhizobium medicae]MDX1164637.1 hypothetical protein [Sinorhizobium medicae]